ncbi:MAG: hypothetical protein IPJ19_19355 [Planctomycetes bacterium]|nr:hypothetical protein [Planctomycetota bacterium]
MIRVLLLVLLALLCTAGLARAQEKPVGAGICTKCKNVGRLVCPEHDKQAEERLYIDEDAVEYCSVIADCPVCAGTGWIVCPQCKPQEIVDALAKKKELLEKRRISLKYLDEKMKRPLCKGESAHFVLTWDLEKLKVEKKFVTQHQALHLYLTRLEQLYTDYTATLQVKDREFAEKIRVLVWYLPSDQDVASTVFCDINGHGGVKLMGIHPTYSLCGNKQNFQSDERLHRNIVHNVTHLLMSAQAPAAWIGNQKYGWADEGLAHWFTDRYWNLCDTYCFQEQNTNVDFKSGHFKVAVRKMVAAGEQPSVAEIFQKTSDSLSLPMNAVSMSYVDFLIFKDAPKFLQLVRKFKDKVPGREALQQVYEMNLLDFEAQWKAWVLATYPKL